MGGSCVRTFETLPRVEPGLARAPQAGGGRGAGRARAGKAGTLATLPRSSGGGPKPPLGAGPAGAGGSQRRPGAEGRAAPRGEKRRPESPRPGRLCERAEAAAVQASRWVWVPGGAGVALRAKVRSRRPRPRRPIRRAGGRAGGAGLWGRAPGPSTFPGSRASAAAAGCLALGRGREHVPRGEGFQETKALDAGRGPAPLGSLCGHVHHAFVGLCRFGSGDVHLPEPLCVRGFVWLFSAYVHVLWARIWLWVWVGSSSCVRVRGLCLSTCLGWMSVECVRAESQTPPQLLAPLLSTRAPDLTSNFSPGSSGNSPRPPPAAAGAGALAARPSFTSWGS